MDESLKPQETQHEFFEEFSKTVERPERLPSLKVPQTQIRFQLTIEQAILTGILVILAACLVFFLGILRGRSTSNPPTPAVIVQKKAAIVQPLPAQTAVHPIRPSVVQQKPLPAPAKEAASTPTANVVVLNTSFDSAKPYTIQLVTYKKKEWADKEVASLKKRGYAAFVAASGPYYLVCAGQYANSQEAREDLRRFKPQYKDCYLKRR